MKTFNQVMDACVELAEFIHRSGWHPDALVGVARGGLTPAHWLAQFLGVRRVTAVGVEFVDEARTNMRCWSRPAFAPPQPRRLLVVEDVVDTGRLLRLATLQLDSPHREVRTATLYKNRNSTTALAAVDYVFASVGQVPTMPWETGREATEL